MIFFSSLCFSNINDKNDFKWRKELRDGAVGKSTFCTGFMTGVPALLRKDRDWMIAGACCPYMHWYGDIHGNMENLWESALLHKNDTPFPTVNKRCPSLSMLEGWLAWSAENHSGPEFMTSVALSVLSKSHCFVAILSSLTFHSYNLSDSSFGVLLSLEGWYKCPIWGWVLWSHSFSAVWLVLSRGL